MLCDLVSRKINKLAILQIFLKSVLKRSYHIQGFMAIKPNDQCYGNIHGIVCLNEPILCIHIRIYMANNVAEESFQLYRTKKSFSIFSVSKRQIFVKHVPRIRLKMVPHHFCKILDHILSTIHQPVASKSFLVSSRKKDKFLPI